MADRGKSFRAMPAPLRTLLLIATIATSIGLWAGMLLRWTQPNLLATVALFQGVQSFPDASWPGTDVPQPTADLPAPESADALPALIGSPRTDPPPEGLPEVDTAPIMSPEVSDPEPEAWQPPAEPEPIAPAAEPLPEAPIDEAPPPPPPEPEPEPDVPIEPPPEPPPEPDVPNL